MRPMKSMFHQSRKSVPSLNVASMPDLIFTVLFFFMIIKNVEATPFLHLYFVVTDIKSIADLGEYKTPHPINLDDDPNQVGWDE